MVGEVEEADLVGEGEEQESKAVKEEKGLQYLIG